MVGVGAIIVVSMGVALVGWAALLRSSIPLKGIKDIDAARPAVGDAAVEAAPALDER